MPLAYFMGGPRDGQWLNVSSWLPTLNFPTMESIPKLLTLDSPAKVAKEIDVVQYHRLCYPNGAYTVSLYTCSTTPAPSHLPGWLVADLMTNGCYEEK